LLVDDNPANLLALESVLEPLDQTLVRAMSGEEALKCVAEQEFAVILMDARMPVLDGFETASRIRQQKQGRHTPIIFTTADGEYRDHAFRGYSHGAVDFLVKPLDPAALVSKIKVFVDLYLRGETIRAQEAALREAEREALARQSETRLQTIIDLMPLCVLALHADGKPYFGNRAWREYTRIELDGAASHALLEAVHPEDRARAQRASAEAVATGKGAEIECRFRSAHDGSFRWHVVRGLPELGADGNVLGWIVTAYRRGATKAGRTTSKRRKPYEGRVSGGGLA
jgi:CheY-like chemotaxis protein